ncbi:MAG: phosphatase PAP2 family protein [Candidatus Marinimicrobia bacterium]|nr:phosphatase PAP2 family protein [Candidatus Neomarinimicrobiota bacterium]
MIRNCELLDEQSTSFMKNIKQYIIISSLFMSSVLAKELNLHCATYWTESGKRFIMDQSNQQLLGGAAITTLALTQIDVKAQNYIQSKGLISNGMANVADYWGIGGQLLLWGSFINKKDKNERLVYAMNAFVANGLITYGLKFAIGKERPDKSNNRSFPSAHTSNSFLTATIAQETYGSKVGVPAYMLACITGLSRIHDDKHYLSDVIFGAALGTTVGRAFSYKYHKNMFGKVHVSITPQMDLRISFLLD